MKKMYSKALQIAVFAGLSCVLVWGMYSSTIESSEETKARTKAEVLKDKFNKCAVEYGVKNPEQYTVTDLGNSSVRFRQYINSASNIGSFIKIKTVNTKTGDMVSGYHVFSDRFEGDLPNEPEDKAFLAVARNCFELNKQ